MILVLWLAYPVWWIVGTEGLEILPSLGIETLGEPASESDSNVVVTPVASDGGATPQVTVQREVADGFLHLAVEPEQETSYAVYSPDGADEFRQLQTYDPCDCDSDCECKVDCLKVNNSAYCPDRENHPGIGIFHLPP
jgi:hypothetical protein